jgi:hypothetical protein
VKSVMYPETAENIAFAKTTEVCEQD